MVIFFIKKIFKNSIDNLAHLQFVRFGKGKLENKAVLKIRKNGKIKINGNFEIVNDLVLFSMMLAKKAKVNGLILVKESDRQETEKILGEKAIKKRGSWMIEVNKELSYEEVERIRAVAFHLLIDLEADGIQFKTKKKLPKSTRGVEKANDKFCTLQMDNRYWQQVKDEFLFDLPEGKKFEMRHIYLINEIILPQGEKDYQKIRLLAKRKGRIIRKVTVDGKEHIDEMDFIA